MAVVLAASYVFYSWWDARFLSLIVISTITDYSVARLMDRGKAGRRRALLLLSIAVNLGILGFFKYWGFFTQSAASFLARLGLEANLPLLRVILPVGISFYTFQTLSYTVDVYRRKIQPESNLLQFATFVAFFPQLVAGPIERASHLLPQLREWPQGIRQVAWSESLGLIARGLFRKVVIADGVAPIVNEVFAAPGRFNAVTIWIGVLAFSIQIYGDFAGYTDLARGTAKLFGVDLMENFRSPYLSTGFSEFWHRWHISLSTWLRDYLYIPLGGNRGSRAETYRNLMVTMILGGLWHGAAWGFILWGTLHGLYLSMERVWSERRGAGGRSQMPAIFVFLVVSLTWIPFRSPTISGAFDVVQGLTRFVGGQQLSFAPVTLAVMGTLTLLIDRAVLQGRVNPLDRAPAFARGFGYGLAAMAAILFASQSVVPFLYFQF